MPWTALQAALGDTTADLTFDMIVRAGDAGVKQTAASDWKTALPLTELKGEPGSQPTGTSLYSDAASWVQPM